MISFESSDDDSGMLQEKRMLEKHSCSRSLGRILKQTRGDQQIQFIREVIASRGSFLFADESVKLPIVQFLVRGERKTTLNNSEQRQTKRPNVSRKAVLFISYSFRCLWRVGRRQ